jgi:hypothetical protein
MSGIASLQHGSLESNDSTQESPTPPPPSTPPGPPGPQLTPEASPIPHDLQDTDPDTPTNQTDTPDANKSTSTPFLTPTPSPRQHAIMRGTNNEDYTPPAQMENSTLSDTRKSNNRTTTRPNTPPTPADTIIYTAPPPMTMQHVARERSTGLDNTISADWTAFFQVHNNNPAFSHHN